MKELKGTKTYENLMAAFAGESQARNIYTGAPMTPETITIDESGMTFGPYPYGHCFHIEKSAQIGRAHV